MKKESPVNLKYYVENTAGMADRHFHCHEQIMSPGSGIEPHIHDWVELLYCTEGNLRVFLGNSAVDFVKDSLVVIPAGQVHFITAKGGTPGSATDRAPCRYVVIKFSPELLFSMVDESDYDCLIPFLLKGDAGDYLCTGDALRRESIGDLVEHMLKEYNEKAYAYRLALRADAGRLILFILRQHGQWRPEKRVVDDTLSLYKGAAHVRRVFDVIVHIQKHYSEPITLEDMANLCHVSYSYFSRQFSGITGQSFASFLCSVRLSAAEHLLITTDTPITEVAFQVGFSDASYFTRRFTAKNEMTPGAYRKRYSVVAGGVREE